MSRRIAILVGLILGDGYLTKPCGASQRTALDIKYDEKCLSYLEWLHKELSIYNPSPIRKKKGFHQFRFYTKRTNEIGELRRLFYRNGKKIIPQDIANYLVNPITLAV